MSTTGTVGIREDQPAVEVKDRGPYHDLDTKGLEETQVQAIYEGVQHDFWEVSAPELAERFFGNREVISAGRSGGWLVPEGCPDFTYYIDMDAAPDGTEDDYEREAFRQRDTFLAFAKAVTEEVDYCRGQFRERVAEAVEDRKRTDEHNRLAAAAWRH